MSRNNNNVFTNESGSYACYVDDLHLGYNYYKSMFTNYCEKRLASRFDISKIQDYKNMELEGLNIPYFCFRHLI